MKNKNKENDKIILFCESFFTFTLFQFINK